MDKPPAQIARAIDLCAGAATADSQITAFEHYFTPSASFLHPLCYVPSGPDSRRRIIGIYLFYRGLIPHTSFEIQHVAFDKQTNHIYVGLIQRPEIWGLRAIWVPEVPMHIHFHLREVGGRYYIDAQEDLVQARSILMAIPIVKWWGALFYFLCEMMGLLSAFLFMALGIWKPVKHLNKHVETTANFH